MRGVIGRVCTGVVLTLLPTGFVYADTSPSTAIGGNPVWTALKLLVSLGALIALAVFGIRFLAKRTQLGGSVGDVRVLAIRQVAPNRSVQVIEVAEKQYLIGVGDQITLLAELDLAQPLQVESEKPLSSFAKTLQERIETLRSKGEKEKR